MFDSISHSPWFLIGLCLVMAVGFSSYLVYCLKKGKLLYGTRLLRSDREWVCRDKDPVCYWFYMAIFAFAACISIFLFITLSYQFINGLPLKL
jgi:hypothetical protein